MIPLRTLVLAHGSGIDEILGLALPALIVGGLWLWSRHRRPEDADAEEATAPDGDAADGAEEGPAVS